KQLFTPEQAEIAKLLTYRLQSLQQIQERARTIGKSAEETERVLDSIAARGVIGSRKRNGVKHYRTIPFLVGMLEGAAITTPPEKKPPLMAAADQFFQDGLFLKDFINTKIPQMRTIPVQKSITPQNHVGSYDEIRKIIEQNSGPIVIFECVCRAGAERQGQPCKRTSRKETCMALGEMARSMAESKKLGRLISREEALDILQKNQDDGLVLQPSNSQAPDAICSCCGCCCGLLRIQKMMPNPVSRWATNFFAVVDNGLCTGCGACEERCQVGAMKMDPDRNVATVDLTRCLGCGLCVPACPEIAIALRNKATETVPPPNSEEMMEVIMMNKA
ncbi:MAG: 4Fe-4S ferredoxin iron-sulfur binding domain protein, partial [Acidobacteria bacterium]|nr:4Fe-4S ferredoxin iron-sulfur binding domain protein [Acidobacteriota bacterium]